MIIGNYKYILDYEDVIPNLKTGLKAIENASKQEVGKYMFEGGYYMIQEGHTKNYEDSSYEFHKKYIDVQIMLEGCEEIIWHDLEGLNLIIPYDDNSDKGRMNGEKINHILINEGMFWVAFPHDAHQAISHFKEEHTYRKIVLKLLVKNRRIL